MKAGSRTGVFHLVKDPGVGVLFWMPFFCAVKKFLLLRVLFYSIALLYPETTGSLSVSMRWYLRRNAELSDGSQKVLFFLRTTNTNTGCQPVIDCAFCPY